MNGQDKLTSNGATKPAQNFANIEAIEFLNWLRPPPWILIAITPDGPPTGKTVHYAQDADAFISEYNGKRNIYYSVNPAKTALNKKPKKVDIAAVEFLLGDLDPRADEKSEDAKTRYLEQLNGTFEPKPSAKVDSGNGIQGLWRLAERIILPEDEEQRKAIITDVEARSAALMLQLGAEAGTQNIDRIFRLPGTINLPNGAKVKAGRVACPTRLIESNGASYPLELFVPGSPDDGGHHARQEQQEEPAHEVGGDKSDDLWETIRNCDAPKGERSHKVWWVINELLRQGYLPGVIVSTLLDRANKISAHFHGQPNPRTRAERYVNEARAKMPKVAVLSLPESQWFGEKPITPPPALIKGLLPQTGVAVIGGQSGGGKTFQALHLAARLMPDYKQHSYIDCYRINRKGGVLYFVLEGKPAFSMRVAAAFEDALDKQMKFGDRPKVPFAWNAYEPNLFKNGPGELIKLAVRDAAKMKHEYEVDLVAVFIDTMGLAACYENEDKAAQVQRVVSGLNQLSDATGALVIGVDHYGKDQGAGLRGSSAKRGHVETILACLVDRDKNDRTTNHRLKFEKIRDGEEGRIVPYRLKPVSRGVDEDGDPVSTCIIQWEPQRPLFQRRTPQRPKTDVTLDRAINEVKLPADPDALKAAFYRFHGGSNHAANAAWHRAIKSEELALIHGKFDHSL